MFAIGIRTAPPDTQGVDPGVVVFKHHLTDRAQITIDTLSGGHLLHLAVAGCLFNDILREAGRRGIALTDLQVTADGDFSGEPLLSTGVSYTVTIAGEAADAELRRLVSDCQAASAVANSLYRGTPVTAREVQIR
jgi:putative redox protein